MDEKKLVVVLLGIYTVLFRYTFCDNYFLYSLDKDV